MEFVGKKRYQPERWPEKLVPTLYELAHEPYGPFPESKTLGDFEGIRILHLPGHSIGKVGGFCARTAKRLISLRITPPARISSSRIGLLDGFTVVYLSTSG
jgi:hypothetical protein